jgi:hypothetical protein
MRARGKGRAAGLTTGEKQVAATTARDDINKRRRPRHLLSSHCVKLHFFLANWADSQSRPSYKPSPDVAQVA